MQPLMIENKVYENLKDLTVHKRCFPYKVNFLAIIIIYCIRVSPDRFFPGVLLLKRLFGSY